MLSTQQCLDYAAQCERLAALEHRDDGRARLIALARRWSELALDSRARSASRRA